MRKNSVKNIRINSEVQREMSSIIREDLKDPRIHPMTSVMAVEVTPDLKFAKIFVSVLGNDEEKEKTMEGLKKSASFALPPAGKAHESAQYARTYFCSGHFH